MLQMSGHNMRKTTKYLALGTVGMLFLLVCVVAAGIYWWLPLNPYCSEGKEMTATSPDGKYSAIVFQRGCGVGVESYAHVNLFKTSEKVRPRPISGRITLGTVFVANWYHEHLKAQWSSPRTLLIDCGDCPQDPNSPRGVAEQRSTWQDVSIMYKLRDDTH
jgi:hypothetical protein